jgi:hypothetical protein
MKGFPPVVLVETWLFITTNRNNYDFVEVELSVRRNIKYYFGSMELAQLYVDQFKNDVENNYYV